jgi:uncharacterized protein YdaU (DUF1376 family)
MQRDDHSETHMSRAWMPFYVGDYLRDTMHLTPMQHGMYILLIFHYWENGCLPQSTSGRSRVARCSISTFAHYEPTLAVFFQQPGWRHKRIDQELAKLENIKIKRSLAARTRWDKPNKHYTKIPMQMHGHNRDEFRIVTCKSIHNHKERKKEATDKEGSKRPDQVSRAELEAMFALRNGRAVP